MRAFVSTDFTGHFPVGTAAVVVANSLAEAERLLLKQLEAVGLGRSSFTMTELDLTKPHAAVLVDGNY